MHEGSRCVRNSTCCLCCHFCRRMREDGVLHDRIMNKNRITEPHMSVHTVDAVTARHLALTMAVIMILRLVTLTHILQVLL
jgi:hypothetical protein